MGVFTLQRLFDRNGRLYYRRVVPEDVRDVIGKSEWKKSLRLKVGQEPEALAVCRKLDQLHDRSIEEARANEPVAGPTPSMEAYEAQALARRQARDLGYFEQSQPLKTEDFHDDRMAAASDVFERGRERLKRAKGWSEEELFEVEGYSTGPTDDPHSINHEIWHYLKPNERYVFDILMKGQMEPLPVPRLSQAYQEDVERLTRPRDEKPFAYAVRDFTGFVGDLPIDRITRRDVELWVQHCIEEKGQKASTVRRRVNSLKALHNRILHRYELENKQPFSRLEALRDDRDPAEQRLPFHTDHLACIDLLLSGAVETTPEVRLILGFLKHTGARLGEITGLERTDLFLEDPIPFLVIRKNATRPTLKTRGSARTLPIPECLLEDLRGHLRGTQGPEVFPSHSGSKRTNTLSQKLAKLIRKAGVPKSARLTCHSFRHTLKEALCAASIGPRTQDRILGHSSGSVADRYGSPQDELGKLKMAMEEAYKRLGEVPLSIYRADELPPVETQAQKLPADFDPYLGVSGRPFQKEG